MGNQKSKSTFTNHFNAWERCSAKTTESRQIDREKLGWTEVDTDQLVSTLDWFNSQWTVSRPDCSKPQTYRHRPRIDPNWVEAHRLLHLGGKVVNRTGITATCEA